jgi:hypothetical protein
MAFRLNPITGQLDLVGSTSGGVSSVNGQTGTVVINAINQLTGDVTTAMASGSESEVASLVATSNSTLTTLSALSLPTSQLSGDILLTTQVSGILPLANGGTNSTSAQTAINTLAGSVTSGDYLRGNGTNVVMSTIQTGDIPNLSATYVTQSEVGVANGVVPLDGSAKISATYLPSVVMEYQQAWNPNTNTPALVDGTGTNGFVYRVSTADASTVAGLTDASMVNFNVGDLIIYSAAISKWQKAPAVDGVSSVNSAVGAVTVNAINQLTGDITAGPASGSQSEVASLVATSNATLTTLSALSLPGSQVTGNISGNAANVTGVVAVLNGGTGTTTSTGTGSVVLSNSPTLVNPALGTPSALVGTNITGTASGLIAGTVTTNANLTGVVTSVGNTTSFASTTGTGAVVLASAPTLSNPIVGTQSTTDNSTKAASTAYVTTAINNAIAGVNPATAVQAATAVASNTSGFTYNNGVSGIGATLTGSVNTALTVDGFTFTALGQRLLVKNDTQSPSGAFNGIYYVTQLQTGILPVILTRALDYDQPSDINNTGAIPVVNGTVNANTSWLLTSTVNTIGTDPLTYIKFSSNPATIPVASSGDINETQFTAADNQSSAANVTGLAFANASVRSADILLSIVRASTYAQYKISLVQGASSWYIDQEYAGDATGLTFTVTTAGQVQYVSSSTGSTANLHFRAITTSVSP